MKVKQKQILFPPIIKWIINAIIDYFKQPINDLLYEGFVSNAVKTNKLKPQNNQNNLNLTIYWFSFVSPHRVCCYAPGIMRNLRQTIPAWQIELTVGVPL